MGRFVFGEQFKATKTGRSMMTYETENQKLVTENNLDSPIIDQFNQSGDPHMSTAISVQESPQPIKNIPPTSNEIPLESTDVPSSEATPTSFTEPRLLNDVWGKLGIGIPLQMAKEQLPLRPDLVDLFTEFDTQHDDIVGKFYAADDLELFKDPKNAHIVSAINLCFLPENLVHLHEALALMEKDRPDNIPSAVKSLQAELVAVISLFPDLQNRLGFSPTKQGLLRLPEVARMLTMSESLVRKLAIDGKIEFTRSQGETGHYRFTLSAVREYVESRKVN